MALPATPPERPERRARLILAGILALAAILRFWALDFGLPLTGARPDETAVIDVTLHFLRGDFKPGFFDYPWLYPWIVTACYLVYYAFGVTQGWFASVADLVASWPVNWAPFFLIARALSAACGTLTVLGVYAIGRRLWSTQIGLIAALFMAVAFLHVRDSHYGSTDAMMTMLLTFSTVWLIRGHLSPARDSFMHAGLLGGLAVATKYTAGVVMFPVLVSQAIQIIDAWRTRTGSRFDGRMFWFGVPAAIAFSVGIPFVVLDYDRFREAADLLIHSTTTGLGVAHELDDGWFHHLRYSLWHGVGGPMLIAGVIGMLVQLKQRPRLMLVVLTFPLISFLLIGSVRNLFFRYAIPVVPFLCLFAAWAAVTAGGALAARLESTGAGRIDTGRLRMAATALLVLLITAAPAWSSIRFNQIMSRTDSRVQVAQWFDIYVRQGATVIQSGSQYGYAQLAGERFTLWPWDRWQRVFVATQRRIPVFSPPDYIVLQDSPLPSETQESVTRFLASGEYSVVHEIRAFDPNRPGLYDRQDAFFVPFAGFSGVEYPGPNFVIYRRHVPR